MLSVSLFFILSFLLNYDTDFVSILLFIHLVYYFYISLAISYLLGIIYNSINSKDFYYNILIILDFKC